MSGINQETIMNGGMKWIRAIMPYCMALVSVLAVFLSLTSAPEHARQIMWLVIFGLFAAMYHKAVHLGEARERIAALVIAAVFSLFFTLGVELNRSLSLSAYTDSLIGAAKFAVSLLGFTTLFYALTLLLFDFLDKHSFNQTKQPKMWFSNNPRSFVVVWIVIFISWLPYLIVFFPGCFSPDSIAEFRDGLSPSGVSASHTIIHSMLMAMFIRLGNALGSNNIGAGLYSITQMIIMSAIFSLALRYLAYRKVRPFIRLSVFAFFALNPIHAMYSITGWKDIIFSGLCLLLFIMMIEIFRRPETMLYSKAWVPKICLLIILFSLFRNHAIYALLLLLPFFITAMRKHWRRIALIALVCAAATAAFNGWAYILFGMSKPSEVEGMSVPLQQIARTVAEHGDALTPSQLDALSRFFTVDELAQIYNPTVSDPVKFAFNLPAFLADKSGFMNIWAELGLKYPGTYITSFLCNSYGYWHPDVSYWIVFTGVPNDIVQPAHPVLENRFFYFDNAPVLSMLGSIGFWVWVIIFSVGRIISKRRKNMLIPILLPGFLWLGTLATPIFAEYRYAYGIILCAPIIFVLANLEAEQPSFCPNQAAINRKRETLPVSKGSQRAGEPLRRRPAEKQKV